jgi:hypothetical protein
VVITHEPPRARRGPEAARRVSGTAVEVSLAVAVGLVVAQTCFRAWALLPSWFYTDDYRLLMDAEATPLGLGAVLKPFDSQFMPAGRLFSYAVAAGGELNWPLAAVLTLVLSTAASLACLYMLVTVFGAGWASTGLLALYLSTTLNVPALMWWAAALNQVGPQACFFLAVAWWFRYLRTGRTTWAVAALAAVALALTFYVKALLFLPVLAFLAIAYHQRGGLRERVSGALRDHWRVVLPSSVIAAAFVAWYSTSVEQAYAGSQASQVGEVANAMLGRAMPTGLLGGPWQWWNTNPPIVIADPADFATHASWVVLALAIAYTCLRRANAWSGWVLIAGYALLDFLLLATSRGQEYGAFAGLDYRYLTDLAPVAVLGVGLAVLRLPGAPSGSVERERPLLLIEVPRRLLVAGTAVVCVGGVTSTIGYVDFWHEANPGDPYVHNLMAEIEPTGTYDLVNQVMPTTVMPSYSAPLNQTERFTALLAGDIRFPDVSADLRLVDPSGHVVPAVLQPAILSQPGPREGCGWLVRSSDTAVPLGAEAFDFGWWLEISYLSGSDTTLAVTAGDTTHEVPFERGLGRVMMHVTGQFDEVVLEPAEGAEDAAVCIDKIEVGDVTAE